jgi:hypothetical protein
MSVDGPKLRKTFARAMPVGVLAALLAGAVWVFWPAGERRRVVVSQSDRPRPVMSDGLALKPVDLPVALLFDCYENALENVPPRTDTSKRQWSWEAPPLPMDVARRELGKPGASENDRKVLAWLEGWEEGWKKDYPTTTDQLWRLEPLLKESKLSFEPLFEIGLAMSFVDGDEQAANWMARAIRRIPQSVESSQDLLDKLAQSRSLWLTRDYNSLRFRFEIERRLEPVGSVGWRKSVFLLAESEFYLGDVERAKAFADQARVTGGRAGDFEHDDLLELDWLESLLCYRSSDYRGCMEHLHAHLTDPRSIHRAQAMPMAIRSLAELGKIDESRALFEEWRAQFKPPLSQTIDLLASIERNSR